MAIQIVRWVISSTDLGIIQHLLKNQLEVVVFSDSIFSNNHYQYTQLGFLILLIDETKRTNIVHFSSYKSKRVVPSVPVGELYLLWRRFRRRTYSTA